MAKATIQIRIDPDLLAWVDEKAGENERSRSWIINDRLRQSFQQDTEMPRALAANPRS
ncbi:MAG: ribbon-helix-helix domain-containing protein [Synergistaceae bacterium]|jgi:predicted transcriptional regulator|nr:ribbon-helix-helix domain-containing protein [Synergistaceae bacterium]